MDGTRVYWTTNNVANSFISSIDLDGSQENFKFLGSNTIEPRGLAIDAGHVYWISRGENKIGRANLDLTGVEQNFLTGIEKSMGLATDGDHLYWSANGDSLPNAGNDFYRFKADAPSGHRLTDIAPDETDENGIEVQGVLGASTDGSYLYYAANGIPEGGVQNSPNANGESAGGGTCKGPYFNASGVCNLYLWHDDGTPSGTTTFIARLDASGKTVGDAVNWIPSSAGFTGSELFLQKTARVSSDGRTLLFRSRRSLTSYPTEGINQLYRYHLGDSGMLCVSCNPTGDGPAAEATLTSIIPPQISAASPAPVLTHNLSADGNRIFFETNEALVAADTNADEGCPPWGATLQLGFIKACQDAYEWEAKGTGSCHSEAQNGGCLYLLSTGKSIDASFFLGASESGKDAFIMTSSKLVRQDEDLLLDVYDARVEGGLASQNQAPPVPCEGEACKGGTPAAPQSPSAGTQQFSGPGNPKSAHKKAKKKQKKHKRHASKRHHHKRNADKTRRAGR